MDYWNLIFGIFFVVLGCISLYAYLAKNEKLFWKKERMIKFWGKKLGTCIHFVGYVLVPVIVGAYLIITSLM